MAIVDPELFVITVSEISIALGEAPISVVVQESAYWYDDQCVALNAVENLDEDYQNTGDADYPFFITVNLAGGIPADRRKALGDYVTDSEITLAVIGGDETRPALDRLLASTA
jgi:hypothetical protein